MDIKNYIESFVRDRKMNDAVNFFSSDKNSLNQLIDLACSEKSYPFPEYGSWILFHIQKKHPTILIPYHNRIIDCFLSSNNGSLLRNVTSILSRLPQSNYREGEYLDKLFYHFHNPESKVALKVNSSYCIFRYLKLYPELISEVKEIFHHHLARDNSPALKSAFKKFQKKFNH